MQQRSTSVSAAAVFLLTLLLNGAASQKSLPTACTADAECPQLLLVSRLTAWMNRKAKPCDNFYEFACGNFSNAVGSPNNQLRMQSLADSDISQRLVDLIQGNQTVASHSDPTVDRLYQFVRDFGEHCNDFRRLVKSPTGAQDASVYQNFAAALLSQLEEEILSSGQNSSAEVLLAVLVKHNPSGRFSLGLHSKTLIEAVSHPDKILPLVPSLHANCKISGLIFGYDDYFKYFISNINSKSRLYLSRAAFRAVSRYAEGCCNSNVPLSLRGCFRESPDGMYTVEELDRITKCASKQLEPFIWTNFFERLLDNDDNVGKRVVHVTDVPQLVQFVMLVKSATVGIDDLLDSSLIRFLILDWLSQLSHQVAFAPSCAVLMQNSLGSIVSSMFYAKYFYPGTIQDVESIVTELVNVTARQIQRSPLLSAAGKVVLLRRLTEQLQYSIGYNQLSTSEMKRLHQTLIDFLQIIDSSNTTTSTSSHFGQLLWASTGARWFYNVKMLLTGERNLSAFDNTDPFKANAFLYFGESHPGYNLVVPLSYMWPLFYHTALPRYINIGSIGSTIAHEIGHIFHDQELIQWLNLTAQKECLVRQYSQLHSRLFNSNDAANTFSEDFSDTIGIRIASEAAKRSIMEATAMPDHPEDLGLTGEQQFFVLAAQQFCSEESPHLFGGLVEQHSVASVRVNGQMMNSGEFAHQFGCRPGDRMNQL